MSPEELAEIERAEAMRERAGLDAREAIDFGARAATITGLVSAAPSGIDFASPASVADTSRGGRSAFGGISSMCTRCNRPAITEVLGHFRNGKPVVDLRCNAHTPTPDDLGCLLILFQKPDVHREFWCDEIRAIR